MSATPADVINLTNKVRERVGFRKFARLARERRGQIHAEIHFPKLGEDGFGHVVIEYERGLFQLDKASPPQPRTIRRTR